MATQFWDYPVWPNSFHPPHEKGMDYRTPFHTPLYAPWGGIVTSAGYHDWGGEIDYKGAIPDRPDLGPVTFSIVHLDEIDGVHVGSVLTPGQAVGLSGGENPGYPGAEHPAKPYYSAGPHTEFDVWTGAGIPWRSPSVNPDPLLRNDNPYGNGFGNPLQGLAGEIAAGLQNGITGAMSAIGQTFEKAIGVASLNDLAWRFGLTTVGGILVIMGIAIFLGKYGPGMVDSAAQKGQQGLSLAASVAALAA